MSILYIRDESGKFIPIPALKGDKGDRGEQGIQGEKGDGLQIVTTTGTGAAYEATVKGITELKAGVSFVMIPHVMSSTTNPSLNVNGLGAEGIRRGSNVFNSATVSGGNSGWLQADYPCRVMYNGQYWIAADMTRPDATDLVNRVRVSNGGVPETNAANKGMVLTINDIGIPEWQEPSMLGEWVFNDYVDITQDITWNISCERNGTEFNTLSLSTEDPDIPAYSMSLFYYSEDGNNSYDYAVYTLTGGEPAWNGSKEITILKEPPADAAAWIKANAKRKQPVGVDKVTLIITCDGAMEEISDDGDGISWCNYFAFLNDNGDVLSSGSVAFKIPIVAGENVTFTADGDNQVVKINATGGGSGGGTIKPSEGLEYYPNIYSGEGYMVTGIGTCTDDFVVIPTEYEGEPVDYIEDFAFNKPDTTTSFTSIFIPKTVTGGLYEALPSGITVFCEAESQPDGWYPDWNSSNNNNVIWGFKLGQGGSNSGNSKPYELPRIRFANFTNLVDEETGATTFRFTVENMGGGTLQVGDELQICCRRKYPGGKMKLRQMASKIITEDDLNQRFLKIEVDPSDKTVDKWLFRNNRVGDHSTISAMYFRFKRVTAYSPSDGKECNAIFSNVEQVWKTYSKGPDGYKLSIK